MENIYTWSGYNSLSEHLSSRGYLLHKRCIDYLSHDQLHEKTEINNYWRECSYEYVRNQGRCDVELRRFDSNYCYRSAYLDNLAEKVVESGERLSPGIPLLPVLRGLNSRSLDGIYYKDIFHEYMKNIYRKEAIDHSGGDEYRTTVITKSEQFDILKEIASTYNFNCKRKGHLSMVYESARVELECDMGGHKEALNWKLYTRVWFSENKEAFWIVPFKIFPAWSYYRSYETFQEMIHGANAYISFIVGFLQHSGSEPSKPKP